MAKRVFVSFDFDNDKALKDFIVGQSRNPDSPFEIADWSMKETVPQSNWKTEAREKIKRSDLVIIMLGTQTYRASGVLSEIQIAKEERIPIVQIKGYKDKYCPIIIDAGNVYEWDWENLKKIFA